MSHQEEDPFSSIAEEFSQELDHITASNPVSTNNNDNNNYNNNNNNTNTNDGDNDDDDDETCNIFGSVIDFDNVDVRYDHVNTMTHPNTHTLNQQIDEYDHLNPQQHHLSHDSQHLQIDPELLLDPNRPPPPVRLIQAQFDDICDRQLLYIRGRKVIVTCIDYPLVFWRYISREEEREYVLRYLREGNLINVTPDGTALSTHFYHSTLSAQDMGILVSTSEYHRSYQATPSIFQIDVDDRRNTILQQQYQQQQQQLQLQHQAQVQAHQQTWDWPQYGNASDHNSLLDTADDDVDWADFSS